MTTATSLNVQPWPADRAWPGSRRTGSLSHTGEHVITDRLGFEPTRHAVEEVSDQEWNFSVDGIPCAIWDWHGAGRLGMWSTFGPAEVFAAIFGWRAQ